MTEFNSFYFIFFLCYYLVRKCVHSPARVRKTGKQREREKVLPPPHGVWSYHNPLSSISLTFHDLRHIHICGQHVFQADTARIRIVIDHVGSGSFNHKALGPALLLLFMQNISPSLLLFKSYLTRLYIKSLTFHNQIDF